MEVDFLLLSNLWLMPNNVGSGLECKNEAWWIKRSDNGHEGDT
jgi:hypothetical protein